MLSGLYSAFAIVRMASGNRIFKDSFSLTLADSSLSDFDIFFGLLSQFRLSPIYTIEPHQEDHFWRSLSAVKKYIPDIGWKI